MAPLSFTSTSVILLTWLTLAYALTFATRADGQGTLLNTAHSQEPVQTFTLRHLFYHDLEANRQRPARFAAISVPSLHDEVGPLSTALTKTIKVQKSVRKHELEPGHDVTQKFDIGADYVPVPEITDKDTIVNLATMTSDVYLFNSTDPTWLNLTQDFKDRFNFGYDKDGLRGHIFSNADDSTVILAFKGSSIDPRDKTRNNDRTNDNLFFSCCCATQRPDPYWYGPVCSCREDVYRCNSTCLTSELMREDRYFAVASSIVRNVTEVLFPSANIWATGHSLGGSLASLMGMEFGIPAITFEAPPERLPARRLGLFPKTKGRYSSHPPAYHFGNTADPVYMGACNGFSSSCALAGFSFESQCFTGKKCMYDTMSDKGWRLSIVHHRILPVIEDVLKAYDTVPECIDEDEECADCFNWTFD